MTRRLSTSRRRFLQSAAAGAAVLPIIGAPLTSPRSDHAVEVRPNVYSLLPDADGNDHPVIAAYKAGIATMRQRPTNDPTSWMFQANIHGSTVAFPEPAWNQCQHGSFFFLSWHRMYLYYFERIVRAAAGDPNFVLPYWNYSDDPLQAALPAAFREPADPATNPLFVHQRHPQVNDGAFFPTEMTSYQDAFALSNFVPTTDQSEGFGGVVTAGPGNGPVHGALENQPHDIMHVVIGAHPEGLMRDPRTAAQDPIFWLHHCNIDRLWERWLDQGDGRANPTDAVWRDTEFTFFDEFQKEIVLTGAEIVDVVAGLGYTYDDAPALPSPGTPPAPVPIPEPAPAPLLVADASAAEAVAEPDGESMSAPVTVAAEPGTEAVLLGEGSLEVKLEPTGEPPVAASGAESLATPQQVHLVIEEIKSNQPIGAYYQVYVNLPDDTATPDPNSIYFVGNFSFFGRTDDPDRCLKGACGQIYDITRLVQRQVAEGVWRDADPAVTFVLAGLPLTEGEAIRLEPNAQPQVRGIKIIRQ